MSHLQKLAIRGIRSFNPNEEETIEFMSPLTLILGPNGCGKTTVIEALKAMSSGTMPPSSESGKRFIHDPKIEGAPETKASIKLMFKSTDQKEILAMRTYRATQRAGNRLEFRKLDQIMKYVDENGKEHSVSNSCLDMDSQMAKLFGVSKAVLQNVIFCHQEETLWPFSDQAHLKKIFDEIFDTEKYTRILLELRQEAKNYKAQKKLLMTDFEIRSKDYQMYLKIIKGLDEDRDKLKGIEKSASDSSTELETRNNSLKEYESKEQKLQALDQEIRLLQHEAMELKQQYQKISTNPLYKDFGKKREELVVMLEGLDKAKDNLVVEKAKLEQEQLVLKKTLQGLETEIITIQVNKKRVEEIVAEEGKLAAEYAQTVQRKELETLSQDLGLAGRNVADLKNIDEVIAKLDTLYADRKVAIDKEENEIQEARNQATVALKLRIEEQKQLKALLDEKKAEFNVQPHADQLMDKQFEEVKEKLREYGGTSEENIKYFEQYERQIEEAENAKEALSSALRALIIQNSYRDSSLFAAYRQKLVSELEKKVQNAQKEFGLDVAAKDVQELCKCLKERTQTLKAQISLSRSTMRECVLKLLLLPHGGEEFARCAETVKTLDAELVSNEGRLGVCESLSTEAARLEFIEEQEHSCTKPTGDSAEFARRSHELEQEISQASAKARTVRQSYTSKLHSFIALLHEFFLLSAKRNSSSGSLLSSLQDAISSAETKLEKMAADIEMRGEMLKSYETPQKKVEQQRKRLSELAEILAELRNIKMKHSWTQHKKGELSAQFEGAEQYKELEKRKEAEKAEAVKRQDAIMAELRNFDRVLGDKQLLQSQIEMNISKFDLQKNVKTVKTSYEEKEREKQKAMGELEGKKKILEEIRTISAKYHESLGEAKNLTKTIQMKEKDLATPQYKNIESTMQFLQFQILTADKISDAIMSRHDAIEESVMVYHNKKMEQINKVIKDMWKLTYKGKDIETIEIKSDADKTGSRYHSFNYRIVFKNTDGTELDMRGRCSAGQKVLGSLLIRLALAEAFCADCGILALDEPTTNLDTENISGLAEALTDIINERAGHKNFQLIVISHDEPFIQSLGSKFTEYIWRVDKNEHGYSTLKKVELKEVF